MKTFTLPLRLLTFFVALGLASQLWATTILAGGTPPTDCLVDTPCFGRNNYIEYIRGELPIIFSVPHDGTLTPAEIPNRTQGTAVGTNYQDVYSSNYAKYAVTFLQEKTGRRPHLIINHLKRHKLDANRDIGEAANGHQWAEEAWYAFHGYIDFAKLEVKQKSSRGLYIDLHTGSHPLTEVGFSLSKDDVGKSAETLNTNNALKNKSSLRILAQTGPTSFAELVKGPTSLGGLLQTKGFRVYPSPTQTDNQHSVYYSGGYNTSRHGSKNGGAIDGMQIEQPLTSLKDPTNQQKLGKALGEAALAYMKTHYKMDLTTSNTTVQPSPVADKCTNDFDHTKQIEVNDLLIVLRDWGKPYGVTELLEVLKYWGTAC